MKNQLKSIIMISVFGIFIFGFAIIGVVSKDRTFSQVENRYLQQVPKFSWSNLKDGTFTSDVESYMSDQIFLKDELVTLKTDTDRLLLKKLQNGVYFGSDGYYLQDFKQNNSIISQNIGYVNSFADLMDSNVKMNFLLAPNAVSVMSEKLPSVTQTDDQTKTISLIKKQLSSKIGFYCPYDIFTAEAEKGSGNYYYKTDHHWTAEGSLAAFKGLMSFTGQTFNVPNYTIEKLQDFYGTLYSKAPSMLAKPDTIKLLTNTANKLTVTYPDSNKTTDTLFDSSFKNVKDKYSTFLGGNFPVVNIKSTQGQSDEKVLVIKDSYANCMATYFADMFKDVTYIDMRYYHIQDLDVSEYVKKNGITQIYFVYNIDFVNTDNNFAWLS